MPDLSKYSPDKSFVPSLFAQVNLNDVFIPRVNMPEVNSPSTGGGSGNNTWDFFLKNGGRNPFLGLGIVPAGPAAKDDYWSNRKFTSEADSYQTGSTYKDIGFMIGRDNEDLFAKNRSFWDESFNTVTRFFDKVGGYTAQTFGFLGGLVGIGNANERYSSGSNFADWIAGASDNALSQWGKNFAEDVDNIYRPIYQDAEDRNKGFFRRMLTDAEFWKGDVVDGAAFLGSAYLTAGVGKVLDLGGKFIRATAAMRGLNFADEALALSDEGLSGLSNTTNLSRGATATEGGAALVPNVASPNAGTIYSRYLQESGNFANARKINMGVSTLLNTAGESLFEASDLKNSMVDRLMSETNFDGTPKYTPEEVKNLAAKAARNSFGLNMIVLPISNLWETRMFYGKANPLSARNATSSMIRRQAGLLSSAEIAKRTFGQKGMDFLKSAGEGVVKEGFWEENVQLAIHRMNEDEENLDLGFFRNIGRVLNQYGSQTIDAIGGNDQEASLNIGLGGLIGGGLGIRNRASEIKAIKKDVANYNTTINAMRATAKDFYEKDDEGNVRLDENKQPVINPTNVLSYISSLNKTLSMTELSDNLKDKNMDILHSIVDNENISRLVKAYADNGMVETLLKNLEDAQGYKSEDLMLLGLNPDKESAAPRLEEIRTKALEYKNIHDNIEKNFFVRLRNDDKYGSKARAMKDKLYYLSTRAKNLADLKSKVDQRKESVNTDISVLHSSESDSTVDSLNELQAAYVAAKKRADYLSNEQRSLNISQNQLEDSENEITELGPGVRLGRKKSKSKAPKEEYTAVDEQDLSDAMSLLTETEKALKDFLEENKESFKNIRRNADGTFRYENDQKNNLVYDQGVVKDRNIARDLEMARNATLNVFNRLSDIKYGERYFDNVYSKRKQELNTEVVEDESTEVDENLEDDFDDSRSLPAPGDGGPGSGSQSGSRPGPVFQSPEEWEEGIDELSRLKRERESLEGKEDTTVEDDVRIDEIDRRIEELENAITTTEDVQTDYTVRNSENIPDNKKSDYKEILAQIARNKRNVVKRDGYYEIDGVRYGKVSDLIGNVVPEHMRAGLQNALTAGYTVDSIVKAFFEGRMNQEFRDEIATKISEEAFKRLEQQLNVIRTKLANDGIDIVASNVVVFDPVLKVAGEIDLLGVDKYGNFKIYEIEARQGRIWSQIAGKTGRGPAIYEMTQKQLSAYRNLFANQYGAIPNNISVMFPIDVKYDKDNPSGFIEKVNLKKEIRYTPTANVQIKSTVFQPIRTGSKYDNYDMTSLFVNTFIPSSMDGAKEKLRFLLRNLSFDVIKKKLTIQVKNAEDRFQKRFEDQAKVLQGLTGNLNTGVVINNLDELLKNNAAKLSITFNGQDVAFENFEVVVDRDTNTAEVQFIKKTDRTQHKGVGVAAYLELANQLSKMGITLVSSGNNPKLPGGTAIWSALTKQGYTTRFGDKGLQIDLGKGYQLTKHPGFDNLYSLVGNKELSVNYEGTLLGYMSPANTVAYKDANGKYQILNENTDVETYKRVTGNSEQTYTEFANISRAYKNAYNTLTKLLENKDDVTVSNEDVQKLFDVQMSFGDLDLINVGQERPDLADLVVKGVKVGTKSVITVVNLDENDSVRVMMDKNTRTKGTGSKLYEIDNWVNKNLDTVKKVMNNKRGEKVTDYVAIIETPDGKLHPIAVRPKKDAKLSNTEEFIPDLGTKFTSATSKNVFKNESVSLIPKQNSVEVNIGLRGENVVESVFPGNNVTELEKNAKVVPTSPDQSVDDTVNSFVKELGEIDFKKINSMFAAYPLTSEEIITELTDDFNAGNWSSINEYLEQLKCDL